MDINTLVNGLSGYLSNALNPNEFMPRLQQDFTQWGNESGERNARLNSGNPQMVGQEITNQLPLIIGGIKGDTTGFNTAVDSLTSQPLKGPGLPNSSYQGMRSITPEQFNIGVKQQEVQKPILTAIENAINSGDFKAAATLIDRLPPGTYTGLRGLLKTLGH